MVLHIAWDASYQTASGARSRAGSHFFLTAKSDNPTLSPSKQPPNNGPIHTELRNMKNILSSAV